MRLKKLMAVACAAALTVTAFAGCSKKNDSSSGSDSKGDAKKEYYNAQPVDTGWEWGNVEIVDGGFIPDVIYNPTEEGLIYARTDMGGAYKYNKDTQRWESITEQRALQLTLLSQTEFILRLVHTPQTTVQYLLLTITARTGLSAKCLSAWAVTRSEEAAVKDFR